MANDLKKIPAVFYRSSAGTEPVRDWLKELDQVGQRIFGHDIGKAEFGWPIGMPLCGGFGSAEQSAHGRIARVIFCVSDGRMVLLHGFKKKTPPAVLELAPKRQKGIER